MYANFNCHACMRMHVRDIDRGARARARDLAARGGSRTCTLQLQL